MQINRIPDNNTQNQGYKLIACIEGNSTVNGHPEYWVTMERKRFSVDRWITEYATWAVGWNPREIGENTTNWSLLFSAGHFDFYGEDARKNAIKDMMVRAGILPEPLEAWEKELLATGETTKPKPGIYNLNTNESVYPTHAYVDRQGDIKLDYGPNNVDDDKPVIWLMGDEADNMRKLLNGELEPDKK